MSGGYPSIWVGKNKYFSRFIMEKHLGRVLKSDEVVHHIDRNIFNNKLKNLKVLSKGEHCRLHHLGTTRSDETKKKLRAINLGRTHSEESRRKMREASLRKIFSDESRRRMKEAFLGRTHSDETKLKMRQAKLGNKACLGRILSDKTKQKMSQARMAYLKRKAHDVWVGEWK